MTKVTSPFMIRFLSDFTLGFSDGLTVPFALTAGLSTLGRADTVIYAGLAELCAGSISMGIGGYLSAVDELPASSPLTRDGGGQSGHCDEEEMMGMLRDGGSSRGSLSHASSSGSDEKEQEREQESREDMIRSYLEPLALPNTTVLEILATLRNRPNGVGRVAHRLQQQNDSWAELSPDQLPVWPVTSGLSISLGYVVGGIIPLSPYFFASTVGKGLGWSIALCLIALMAFGAGKSWLLRGRQRSLKRSLLEGLQMLILGSVAAGAAVLCVNLVGADPST